MVDTLLLSLKVALWATGIGLVLGGAAAYGLARWRFVGRNVLDALLTLPMAMPPIVLGYYLLMLLGKRSALGAWLDENFGIQIIFTWQGAVIAASIVSFPLIFKSARAAFESVDLQLEQAARVLGLSEFSIFLRVTLPLAWRGIMAGVLLAFTRAIGEFGATLMVAGSIAGKTQTLSVAMFEAMQAGQDDVTHTLALVSMAVCVAALLLATYLAPGRVHAS